MVKFTFGTLTSVTRAGFTKVTVKDEFTLEKGFGFEATDGLLAFDRWGWEITQPKDEYTASVYGAYRPTSDLTCALVEGTNNNAFLVALPDGDYTVWVVASDAECDPPLFEVWAQTLPVTTDFLRGTFDTRGLKPGIYTLQAKISGPAPLTSQRAQGSSYPGMRRLPTQ